MSFIRKIFITYLLCAVLPAAALQPATVWSYLAQGKPVNSQLKKQLFVHDCGTLATTVKVPAHKKNNSTIRLATFNVHMWSDPFGADTYQELVQDIAALHADVLALQEVITFDLGRIIADFMQLGYTHHIFYGTHTTAAGEFGNMIFSKYPFVGNEVSKTFNVDMGQPEQRNFIRVQLQLPNGQSMVVYTTHLDVYDDTEQRRVAEVQELLADIARQSCKNVVMMGDFNAVRQRDYNPQIWQLLQADDMQRIPQLRALGGVRTGAMRLCDQHGLRDAYDVAQVQHPAWTCWTGKVIDYLLLGRSWTLPVTRCMVLPNVHSDHCPQIMDVGLPVMPQPIRQPQPGRKPTNIKPVRKKVAPQARHRAVRAHVARRLVLPRRAQKIVPRRKLIKRAVLNHRPVRRPAVRKALVRVKKPVRKVVRRRIPRKIRR